MTAARLSSYSLAVSSPSSRRADSDYDHVVGPVKEYAGEYAMLLVMAGEGYGPRLRPPGYHSPR